jgi:flagellar biosynthesis/type III secretory pathway chaperone
MIPETPQTDALLAELTGVLDEQIGLLTSRREQMDRLSSAIVHRDDDAMEPLLEEMERTQGLQKSADERLATLRQSLASTAGCAVDHLRLSRLLQELRGPVRDAVAERRRRLVALSDELRQRHLRTVLLLAESARINRLLLETLFPASQPVTTYDAGGADQWRPDTGLVDTER